MHVNDNDLDYNTQTILPTVFDDSLSYYEQLNRIKSVVKQMIDDVQTLENSTNTLNGSYQGAIDRLNELQSTIDNFIQGYTIKDKTITLKKLADDVLKKFYDLTVDTVFETSKTISFGINDSGYFYVSIPRSWNDIIFSTNPDGHLVLQY